MAVLKYSDLADSGLYIKVIDRGSATSSNAVASLVNGTVPLNQLPEGIGNGGVVGEVAYSFKVNFNLSNPSSVSEVPTGWNVSINGSQVIVSHTVGKMPKFVSYLGYNSATYAYRTPTPFDQLIITESTKNTSFTMSLTNDVAGSQQSGHAYVNILF